MTTGQRIAAKRKELNLSQEALGESLGVSRQSIYKWESDASLPEIDKLVALSRLFEVPVGWLLGVEESAPETEEEEAPAPPPSDDLTDTQLKMVEEIVDRYLAAQPKPKKRRRWPWVLAALVVLYAGFSLFDKLERVDSQYNNLQNSVSNLTHNVSNQISGITNRVEEILKSQNNLTADYSTQLSAWDLARNTVTFSARVVPKTHVEGMEVYFLIDSGDGPAEIIGTMGPGREFTAELTCELTDNIVISAVFVNGAIRQTQLLDSYGGLYSSSLPYIRFHGLEAAFLHEEVQADGTFALPSDYGWIDGIDTQTKLGAVEVESIQVGLFKNFELVCWLEPCEKPENWNVDAEQFFALPSMSVQLEKGDLLFFSAIYTDEYGRRGVEASIPAFEYFGDTIGWVDNADATFFFNIDNYKL